MAVATSTALLIAAGTAAAGTLYTTETARHDRSKAEKSNRRNTQAAKLEAENEDKKRKAKALAGRRDRISGFKRNNPTFSGFSGQAETARKVLTGS